MRDKGRLKNSQKTLSISSWIPLLCVIPCIIIFSRVAGFDFILLDDGVNIYENPYLEPHLIKNTLVFWKTTYEHLYIPVTYTVWQTVAAISQGLKPGFFHFVNLSVHLLNTLILLLLLNRVEKNIISVEGGEKTDISNVKIGAVMGALLFSLHPLQVESVSWITGLKGVLSTLFSLLSISLYLSFFLNKKKHMKHILYTGALFTFILALLSKPSAVMLPFIIIVFISVIRPEKRPYATTLIPWIAISIPFAIITKMAQPDTESGEVIAWCLRPLVAVDALSFYTHKLFFPLNLSVDYGRSPGRILQNSKTWLFLILESAAFTLLFVNRKKNPFFKYMLITILALLPVLGLVPFLFQKISTVSDHYFYMGMTGPALVFSRLCAHKWNKPAWRIAAISIVIIMAFQSFRQVSNWQDSHSLFKHAVKVNPASKIGHTNLGKYYFLNGNFSKARFHYQKLVSYYPDDPLHLTNLASAYFALGRTSDSIKTLEKALAQDPDFVVAHQNLSNIFEKLGRYKEAMFHAKKSLKIEPDNRKTRERIARLQRLRDRTNR